MAVRGGSREWIDRKAECRRQTRSTDRAASGRVEIVVEVEPAGESGWSVRRVRRKRRSRRAAVADGSG